MRLGEKFWLALYYGVAQHLPASYRPCGSAARHLRAAAARHLLRQAGGNINIEPRVDFGSGAQVSLGDHSGIGARSRVEAAVIERGVIMGPEVMILARNHLFTDPDVWIGRQGDTEVLPVTIGEGSWVGARVTILPGVTIGRYCVIGAAAVVSRDVPDYSVVVGNPGRVIRTWYDPAKQEPVS